MKIVKVLIFIALVSLSYERKVQKTFSKVKMSWESDYECKIKVNDNEQGTGKFTPQSILTPNSAEEKLGWVFNMSAGPSNDLKQVMVQVGNSAKWYIPYRIITEEAGFVNPSMDNKRISFTVTLDGASKDKKNIKVLLPYKTFGWYINDEEALQLTAQINKQRQAAQHLVNAAKKTLVDAVNKLVDDKNSLDASKGGDAELKKLFDKNTTEVNTLQASLDDLSKQLETNNNEVAKDEAAIQAKQNTYNQLTSVISQTSASIQESQASLDDIKKNLGNTASNVTKLTELVNASTTAFNSHIDILKKIASSVSQKAEDARTAANNNNKKGISQNINAIYA